MSPSTISTKRTHPEKDAKLRTLEAGVVSAGLPPTKFMPMFRKTLASSADPDRALNNFLRFLTAGFASSLLKDFYNNLVLMKIALTLFGHSQYLADILVRSPELFHWLTGTTALTDSKTPLDYENDALNAVAPFERTEKKLDALKRFQRREILRISARDILKEADLRTVTRELSWLADSIVNVVVQVGIGDLHRRLAADIGSTFSVIGLGKLGGLELNFSSDIDLMFVYDSDGDLDFPAERIHSFHEYYCRLAEFVVRRLSEHTNEGHLYRVDMRLRPDGAAGPLALSREGYLRYYESRGELWERQMLLKARIVGGNKEIGRKFLSNLRPFVYPQTVLHDPREEILTIKSRIEARLGDTTNVKLSKGGIRDIEFVVQALQLLHANVGEVARESNTLEAINKLHQASLLKSVEAQQLRNGYEFLRHVEHRLQLLQGTQTHELPANREEVRLLARRMGFKSATAFDKELLRVQHRTRKIYDSVFLQSREVDRKNVAVDRIWSQENLVHSISRFGFLDAKRAVVTVDELRMSLDWLDQPSKIGKLLGSLGKSRAPDFGLMNFRIIASSEPLRRTIDQVMENEHMVDLLVAICSRSRRLAFLLAREPLLLEHLLGRTEEVFNPGLEWQFLLKSDPLRFRAFNENKIIIRYLQGLSTIRECAKEFSAVADAVVRSIIEDLQTPFPEFASNVCIVALGKYGAEEIVVGSDLDLLLLARSNQASESDGNFESAAVEFVRRFSDAAGRVYDIDLRLRPEGTNAPLTAGFDYYEHYLHDRAELWEKQSLLKARVLHAPVDLAAKFESLKKVTLASAVQGSHWLEDIWRMKEKMEEERTDERSKDKDLKIAKGGIIDLEFLIQTLQLQHFASKQSVSAANSFDAIDSFSTLGLMKQRDAKTFKGNYAFLRSLDLAVRLNSESGKFILPEDKFVRQAIAAGVGERTTGNLEERIEKVRNLNRVLVKRSLNLIK